MAKGRVVKKGEHGVRIVTCIPCGESVDPATGEVSLRTRPGAAFVFHISQTQPRDAKPAATPAPAEVERGSRRAVPITIPPSAPPIPIPIQKPAAPAPSWKDRYLARTAA